MDHTLNYSYELQWTETYQDHQAQTIVNGGGVGTAGSGGAHHQQEEKAVVAPLPHPANHLVPRYYDPNEYPPGYRFCPDDRELVFEYLLKFLYNIGPDPWKKQHPIPTVDVYALSPDKITHNYS
ncbi:OLC1v1036842C1 [Oldenlandia corymbosa var. corymbosa]|uniref:OLC1v1036842C1 n=1 Tax=Oldenlandia corymbosa var. corymbosa TaxID=529605 RepID=A0AAV1CZX5_OLDCO|nr:OLC1v1036842C1 [Oldenlandia corymbosa var. corymbosa]